MKNETFFTKNLVDSFFNKYIKSLTRKIGCEEIISSLSNLGLLNKNIFEDQEKANKISSIISIFGAINIPIIKFSVDWWNTLHQTASISKFSKPNIDPSMMIPLIIMTLAFIFIGASIAVLRIKTEIHLRKQST